MSDGPVRRFDGDYTEAEAREFMDALRAMSKEGRVVIPPKLWEAIRTVEATDGAAESVLA